MKKLSKRKKLERQLDKLWRTVGKENAECEICATLPKSRVNYSQLQAHHIIGRKRKRTRWDLSNRIWVCPSHHTLGNLTVEHNLAGWFWGAEKDWMGTFRPKDKEILEKLKSMPPKKWSLEELEAMIKNLKMLK